MHCAKHLDALLYALHISAPAGDRSATKSYTYRYGNRNKYAVANANAADNAHRNAYANGNADFDSYAHSEGDTNACSDPDAYSGYSHQLRWANVPGQRRSTMVCRHGFCRRFDFFDYSFNHWNIGPNIVSSGTLWANAHVQRPSH
jgi:hypothetical protein